MHGAVASPPAGGFRRATAFLRRHPVLCLLLLTPGIPEYLSGSSALNLLFLNPAVFGLFLAANLGLYGPGALLIREVMVRGRHGWPTLIALGAAYGILEEGIALSTLFNPHAGVVGGLGFYGHFAGVSWVWALGVLMIHVVYSISLPIVLLSIALPETRGRPLLTNLQAGMALTLLGTDVIVLIAVVAFGIHFWMGVPLLLGSLGAIAVLTWVGLRAPPPRVPRPGSRPSLGPWGFGVLGVALFPGTLLLEAIPAARNAPAALTFLLVGAFYALWLTVLVRTLGDLERERAFIALSAGLLTPIALFGFIAGLPVPVALAADAATIWFLRRLWKQYPPSPAVPVGAALPVGA